MSDQPLRLRLQGVTPDVVQALRDGDFVVVTDDTAEHALFEVPAAGRPRSDDTASGDGSDSPEQPTDGRVANPVRTDKAHLTPREREVLGELGRGASNHQIAQRLFIADNTVKNHVRNILLKLDCRSRTQAVVRAHHMGLLDL